MLNTSIILEFLLVGVLLVFVKEFQRRLRVSP